MKLKRDEPFRIRTIFSLLASTLLVFFPGPMQAMDKGFGHKVPAKTMQHAPQQQKITPLKSVPPPVVIPSKIPLRPSPAVGHGPESRPAKPGKTPLTPPHSPSKPVKPHKVAPPAAPPSARSSHSQTRQHRNSVSHKDTESKKEHQADRSARIREEQRPASHGSTSSRHRPEIPAAIRHGKHTAHGNSHLQTIFGRPADLGLTSRSGNVPKPESSPMESSKTKGNDHGKKITNKDAQEIIDILKTNRHGKEITIKDVRELLDIPTNIPDHDVASASQFAENLQNLGGELNNDTWQKWAEGNGDKVLGDAIREATGIPTIGTEGMSPEDLLGLGNDAQGIGVDGITPGFVEDWKNVQNGTISADDLIYKWTELGGSDSNALTGSDGTTGSGGTGNQNSGGSSSLPNGLDSHSASTGYGSGTGSSQNSNDSNTGVPSVTDGQDQQNNNQNDQDDDTNGMSGMNTDSDDDNSTRPIDPGGDVLNIDIDGYEGDHNNDIESASSSSSSSGNGPSGDAGTDQQGPSDIVSGIQENNSGMEDSDDSGIIIIVNRDEDGNVEQVIAQEGAIRISGDGKDEEYIDDKTFWSVDNTESGTGVPVASGMNGPESCSDDSNGTGLGNDDGGDSSSGSDDDSGSSGSDDDSGSSGSDDDTGSSGSDDDNSSSGSDDDSSSSGSDDDNSSSGSDDDSSSSGSDDDSSSSGSDDDSSSSGSDDDSGSSESDDDSSRPDPMADEQGGDPIDWAEIFQTHGGQTGISNPARAEGGRNVNASQINPRGGYRRGQENIIHTTGEEATEESPIPVSDDRMGSSPFRSRSGIELPSEEGEQITPGSDPIIGNPHDNPGAGDPRANDDDD